MGAKSTNPVLSSPNRLKLGFFCTNLVSAMTTAPELFETAWPNVSAVAREADEVGLEALVSVARWKGYVEDDVSHRSHEVPDPFMYAAAISQATSYTSVFATTHSPTVHPNMIAGVSARGRAFAARYADVGPVQLIGPEPAGWAGQVAEFKELARSEHRREIQRWTTISITVRESDEEAEAYAHRTGVKLFDEASAAGFMATQVRENPNIRGAVYETHRDILRVPGPGTPSSVRPRPSSKVCGRSRTPESTGRSSAMSITCPSSSACARKCSPCSSGPGSAGHTARRSPQTCQIRTPSR